MFTKVLTLSTALLVLGTYTTNAVAMNCGEMTPADCKKEFGMEMEKITRMKFTELMKAHMIKMMSFYAAVMRDMPADSMHAKILQNTVDALKAEMTRIDNMDKMGKEEAHHTIDYAFMAMQPDFTKAQLEDAVNAEHFNEAMDNHGFKPGMATEVITTMLTEFEKIWIDIYSSLRPQDMKEYPKYNEMNDMMKKMIETTDKPMKLDNLIKVMIMMMEFNETPFMVALLDTLTSKV